MLTNLTQLRRQPKRPKTASKNTARSPVAEPRRPLYAHLDPLYFEDEWGEVLEFVDYPTIAADYCRKTLSGEWPACNYVKQACRRYLDMLKMAEKGKYGFTFSSAHACDFLGFVEELPLFEDNFRGVKNTELEPWQIWIGCCLYGFRDVRGHRFTNECYLEVPRKQAKSVLATGIGLYDLRNPESIAPLVLIAASTIEQAGRVFEPMKGIIERDAELREHYKLHTTDEYIECEANSGTLQAIASIGKRQDGWNPTTVILEELHAQKPDVYAVLKSALGSRGGQLLFQITTAGRDAFGLAWDNRKAAIRILEGHDTNWRHFAVIYTLDKADLEDAKGNKKTDHLFDNEPLWLKACPNLGVSFDMAAFHSLALSAKQKLAEREEFYRTRLNIWTNSATKLFDIELMRRGMRPDLEIMQFKGKKCWIGVDLSTSQDLTCVSIVFEVDASTIAVFAKFWMSKDSQLLQDPDLRGMISGWIEAGLISCSTHGAVDFREVEAYIRSLRAAPLYLDIQALGFDPQMAGMLMKVLEDDSFPVVKYINRANMMTAPVDDLMSKTSAGNAAQMLYPNDPVFEWCFSNTHGERKKDDGILPFKDAVDSLNKIDGMVATGFADGLRLHPEYYDEAPKPSVYGKRGLKGIADVDTHGRTNPPTDRAPRYS